MADRCEYESSTGRNLPDVWRSGSTGRKCSTQVEDSLRGVAVLPQPPPRCPLTIGHPDHRRPSQSGSQSILGRLVGRRNCPRPIEVRLDSRVVRLGKNVLPVARHRVADSPVAIRLDTCPGG